VLSRGAAGLLTSAKWRVRLRVRLADEHIEKPSE
jgi:hypothetical protein